MKIKQPALGFVIKEGGGRGGVQFSKVYSLVDRNTLIETRPGGRFIEIKYDVKRKTILLH